MRTIGRHLFLLAILAVSATRAFVSVSKTAVVAPTSLKTPATTITARSSFTALAAASEESALSESDQTLLGTVGTAASLVTLYSEFVLKTTGCGLPAGPFGLFGLMEGLSYLGVTGIAAYSVVTKVKTVSQTKEWVIDFSRPI